MSWNLCLLLIKCKIPVLFEFRGQSILKVVHAFHTVCIGLYIGCSGPVVMDLNKINVSVDDPITGPEHPIYRTMHTV